MYIIIDSYSLSLYYGPPRADVLNRLKKSEWGRCKISVRQLL